MIDRPHAAGVDRFISEDNELIDGLTQRARGLREDPLQSFLLFLNLYAEALADMLTVIVEGAIVLSKALDDKYLMGRQTRVYREHVKALFGA